MTNGIWTMMVKDFGRESPITTPLNNIIGEEKFVRTPIKTTITNYMLRTRGYSQDQGTLFEGFEEASKSVEGIYNYLMKLMESPVEEPIDLEDWGWE